MDNLFVKTKSLILDANNENDNHIERTLHPSIPMTLSATIESSAIERVALDLEFEYRVRFAGRPRSTRDMDALARLVTRCVALEHATIKPINTCGKDTCDLVRALRQSAQHELRLVAQEQGNDPDRREEIAAASEVNLLLQRHRRYVDSAPDMLRDPSVGTMILSEVTEARHQLAQVSKSSVESTENLAKVDRRIRDMQREARTLHLKSRALSIEDRLTRLCSLTLHAIRGFQALQARFGHALLISPLFLPHRIETLSGIDAELQLLALESARVTADVGEVRELISVQTPELRRIADAVISAHLSASSKEVADRLVWATDTLLDEARTLEGASVLRHDADKAHQLCFFGVEVYRLAQGRFSVDRSSTPMRQALQYARDALEFHESNWVRARFDRATRH